jgi:hypothetical protein
VARPLQIYDPQQLWRKQVVGAFGAPDLAADATTGFLWVPSCDGTPTGTPEALTGFCPLVVDRTNSKLYFYSDGAWRDAGP